MSAQGCFTACPEASYRAALAPVQVAMNTQNKICKHYPRTIQNSLVRPIQNNAVKSNHFLLITVVFKRNLRAIFKPHRSQL